ncbi:MAG: YlbF family regulator [Ruminococcaceae bacterium]|nr:YlbF family regulator [Oscillospiraceae bacterium]
MDIIELSRELGRKIQQEESYVAMMDANKAVEADEALQALIGEFNLYKLQLNEKLTAAERDEEAIKEVNTKMRTLYADIMVNPSMIKLNESKNAFDALMNRVMAIISNSANGEDPNTTDYHACTGSCSTCGGCH